MTTEERVRETKSTNVRTFMHKRRRAIRRSSIRAVGASMRTLAKVAPSLAIDVARYMFFKPMRIGMHPSAAAVLAEGGRLTVKREGRRLNGFTWGRRDAPTVLLVHGWSGNAAQMTAFVAPLVHRGFRVVAFDLSGHGASEGDQATIVRLAEDVLEIGRYVGGLEAVIAHSFGGPVTTLALLAGLRAENVVFIAPPFDASSWLGAFGTWLGFDETLRRMLKQRLEATVGLGFEELTGRTLAPTMTTPLLVIHDDEDRDVSVHAGEQLAACWPDAELQTTSGLGHQRILRDERVIEDAIRFIEKGTDR